MPRAAPAPGLNVKLPVGLYASCETAGKRHKLTVGQYVEKAIEAQLERDREAYKLDRFADAKAQARANRHVEPLPQDFGLPSPLV